MSASQAKGITDLIFLDPSTNEALSFQHLLFSPVPYTVPITLSHLNALRITLSICTMISLVRLIAQSVLLHIRLRKGYFYEVLDSPKFLHRYGNRENAPKRKLLWPRVKSQIVPMAELTGVLITQIATLIGLVSGNAPSAIMEDAGKLPLYYRISLLGIFYAVTFSNIHDNRLVLAFIKLQLEVWQQRILKFILYFNLIVYFVYSHLSTICYVVLWYSDGENNSNSIYFYMVPSFMISSWGVIIPNWPYVLSGTICLIQYWRYKKSSDLSYKVYSRSLKQKQEQSNSVQESNNDASLKLSALERDERKLDSKFLDEMMSSLFKFGTHRVIMTTVIVSLLLVCLYWAFGLFTCISFLAYSLTHLAFLIYFDLPALKAIINQKGSEKVKVDLELQKSSNIVVNDEIKDQ